MCRSVWGEQTYSQPSNKQRSSGATPHASAVTCFSNRRYDVHHGACCRLCRTSPLEGTRYMCALCSQYDLCPACFAGPTHAHHPFLALEMPSSTPYYVEKPTDSHYVTEEEKSEHQRRAADAQNRARFRVAQRKHSTASPISADAETPLQQSSRRRSSQYAHISYTSM